MSQIVPRGAQCQHCIFFDGTGSRSSGLCRRRPPVVDFSDDVGEQTLWPFVGNDDWCGEWVLDQALADRLEEELQAKGKG